MLLTVNLVGKKRWVKGKGEINVTEPTVARHYNKSMDGIDLVDRALSEMHPNKGGKMVLVASCQYSKYCRCV